MTREEAIQVLQEKIDNRPLFKDERESFEIAIEALHREEAEEKGYCHRIRPKGKWIDRDYRQVDEDAYETATCSNCKSEITIEYPYDNFCPNCGEKMGGDGE